MPLRGELTDGGELVLRDERAGRVARRVDDDPARARRHRARHRLRVNREAVFGVRAHQHRRGVGELDLLGEARPVRRVGDHFVAAAEQRERRVEERLLPARRHHHFRFGVVDAVVGAVAGGNRALELHRP
jgi:hypothetical protein